MSSEDSVHRLSVGATGTSPSSNASFGWTGIDVYWRGWDGEGESSEPISNWLCDECDVRRSMEFIVVVIEWFVE